MTKSWFHVLPVLLLLTVSPGCHKHEDINALSTYTFTNTLPESVTLDFYDSREDYANYRKIHSTYEIQAGATATIPLQPLRTYWLDWYSKSYTYNNWGDTSGNGMGSPGPKLPVSTEDDYLSIAAFSKDTSRSILLNGNQISSDWKVTIDKENPLKGSHLIHLNRDLTGQYTFVDAGGRSTSIPVMFFPYNYHQGAFNPSNFRVSIQNESDEIAVMEFQLSQDPDFCRGRDSLMITFMTIYETYWAVRQ